MPNKDFKWVTTTDDKGAQVTTYVRKTKKAAPKADDKATS